MGHTTFLDQQNLRYKLFGHDDVIPEIIPLPVGCQKTLELKFFIRHPRSHFKNKNGDNPVSSIVIKIPLSIISLTQKKHEA